MSSRSRDAERLWEAMKLAFPYAVRNGERHSPEGTAQLAREFAEALIAEWKRAVCGTEPPINLPKVRSSVSLPLVGAEDA